MTKAWIYSLQSEEEGLAACREVIEESHEKFQTIPGEAEGEWMSLVLNLFALHWTMTKAGHADFAERIRLMAVVMLDNEPTPESWSNLRLQLRDTEKHSRHDPKSP